MTHGKRATAALIVLCCLPFAFASGVDLSLDDARKGCFGHMSNLETSAETWRWVAILVAVLGGATAGVAGLKAGVSEPSAGRKWGIVALISGAIAAASPLLPKSDEFRNRLALSDRHFIVGLKVQRQLNSFGAAGAFRDQAENYAMARYTDCLAVVPPELIPDLPSADELQSERIHRLPD